VKSSYFLISKSEFRNPKQIPNSNVQIFKTTKYPPFPQWERDGVRVKFGFGTFVLVSNFALRISDFPFRGSTSIA
jgi:hypothetical protein